MLTIGRTRAALATPANGKGGTLRSQTLIKCTLASNAWLFLCVTAVVLATRLPFLSAGYGADYDAWRIVGAARDIAITHSYSASRLPGYPVPELFYSVIWQLGPLALNGTTALLSALGAACFALTLRQLGCKHALLAALALALTPVVYINSTVAGDYMWALSFILAALYCTLLRKPALAGLFLGLAIGSRITSGAMLIPLALLSIDPRRVRDSIRRVLLTTAAACLVGAIAFTPVFGRYGPGFFSSTGLTGATRPLSLVVSNATISTWGAIGCVAVVIGALGVLYDVLSRRQGRYVPSMPPLLLTLSCFSAIILYSVAFLLLPDKAAYLLPLIPFVLLLFSQTLGLRLFIGICLCLTASSFLLTVNSQDLAEIYGLSQISRNAIHVTINDHHLYIDALHGPVLDNHEARTTGVMVVKETVLYGRGLPERSIVVAGGWLTYLTASLPFRDPSLKQYLFTPPFAQLEAYARQGAQIYYLPGVRVYLFSVSGKDIASLGAKPLLPGDTEVPLR